MRSNLMRSLPARQAHITHTRPCILSEVFSRLSISQSPAKAALPSMRSFSTTPIAQSWLEPRRGYAGKSRKGRPRVATGGSVRGTTVIWGDYGLRMSDHDRRVSAAQLRVGAETIKKRLRGTKYKLYTRVAANIPVFTSGNEMRMGKGKGTFDYYASRIAVSKIIFEIKGELHEKVVRDAFRLCAAKMPGQYEFVKKGDPPVMGITKVTDAYTLQQLLRPRRETTITTEGETPLVTSVVTPPPESSSSAAPGPSV